MNAQLAWIAWNPLHHCRDLGTAYMASSIIAFALRVKFDRQYKTIKRVALICHQVVKRMRTVAYIRYGFPGHLVDTCQLPCGYILIGLDVAPYLPKNNDIHEK